jgi:hypothetical protein
MTQTRRLAAIGVAPASFDMYVRKRVPWMRPEDHTHMLEGLRMAGWKDEKASVPTGSVNSQGT